MKYRVMKSKQLLSRGVLWPNSLDEKTSVGFSDAELEFLCGNCLNVYDQSLSSERSQWMYWPVELYSFGRCYREWLGLPSWLPLPLYGDHGVCFNGHLAPHESKAKPNVFLTWYKDRAESLIKNNNKKILRVPHPWITFRRRHNIQKKDCAKGTIVFYSHSNTNIEILGYNWDRYFEEIGQLSDEYFPIVICMHRHDIDEGRHYALRKYGYPIVTAGETSSPYFVERFYDLISEFHFATSNIGGSELFYCEELGVRYFLYGAQPAYTNLGDNELPPGIVRPRDAVARSTGLQKRNLFREFPPSPSLAKTTFVSDMLGLDVDESLARGLVMRALVLEYFRHLFEVLSILTLNVIRTILPENIKRMLRQFRSNLRRHLP